MKTTKLKKTKTKTYVQDLSTKKGISKAERIHNWMQNKGYGIAEQKKIGMDKYRVTYAQQKPLTEATKKKLIALKI